MILIGLEGMWGRHGATRASGHGMGHLLSLERVGAGSAVLTSPPPRLVPTSTLSDDHIGAATLWGW